MVEMAEPVYTVASDSEAPGEDQKMPNFPEPALGIDLGTSQCSIAIWNGSCLELLKNTRNQKRMHTYVMFDNEIPSGGVNEELGHDENEIFSGRSIFNTKRLVGRLDTDPVVHSSKMLPFLVQTLSIGARPFIAALVNNVWRSTTPEEVLAIFLVELRAMAEVRLRRAIRNVVLTIPASFSRFQQTRIERACAMAGLLVLRLMPEPTAVALLYAQQQQQIIQDNLGSGYEKVALIFNMGAGYCDVAIAATAGGVSQIKALSGAAVGGEDILQNVMRHVLPNFDCFCASHGINEIKSMGMLRIATQDAIHKLSSQTSVLLNVDLANGSKIRTNLTREEFEAMNHEVFEVCKDLINQCLNDAKVVAEDIVDVILVGGCSYIPKISRLVLGLCKKEKPYDGMNHLEAAACGAALEGAVASGVTDPTGRLDLLTIQATTMSLGIRADGETCVPIIYRNTTVPARKDLLFTTAQDNQTEALVEVYEGEGNQVKDNHLLGFFKISGISPGPKGIPEINVCMDIDASNVLRVLAGVVLPGSAAPVTPFIEVRMPTVDDGHGWCMEALRKIYGSKLDLASLKKAPH
ncbi:heat shock 70 kDa protein 8-like [Aristolochia californica]|uniref:heat shock 70 kDa protein 8-like n=1 Tax=Aristolochia californica TaxID=171875 RepID=UPI0035D6756C